MFQSYTIRHIFSQVNSQIYIYFLYNINKKSDRVVYKINYYQQMLPNHFSNFLPLQWVPYPYLHLNFSNPQMYQNSPSTQEPSFLFQFTCENYILKQSPGSAFKQYNQIEAKAEQVSAEQSLTNEANNLVMQNIIKEHKKSKNQKLQDNEQASSMFQLKKRPSKANPRIQKQGRNKFSNILRAFFKYLQEKSKVEIPVKKIINKNHLNMTQTDFFTQLSLKAPDHRNYIRPKMAKKIFLEEGQSDFTKVLRVLLNYFLKKKYSQYLLNSTKMTKKSWVMHLGGSRQILSLIMDENQEE